MHCINNCLYCKHFHIWDGDPTCIKEFKIILPSEVCESYDRCDLLHLSIHSIGWDHAKNKFFKENIIMDPLKESYLKLFPEDENLIN